MQTTLTVPDKKAKSRGKFQPVKILPCDAPKNQSVEDEPAEPSKEEILEGLREAIHDVKEHIAGRLQLRTLDEFLDEFESQTDC